MPPAEHLTPLSTSDSSKIAHISGLDGLRALSVLVVMFYHAGIPYVHGGYLGVEIFFVISGFLITRLLLNEASTSGGRINLGLFWKRRAARLLPALLSLLFVVTLVGAFVLKDKASQYRYDILASLLYFENWYQIYSNTSYFSDQGLPLLRHIWSLAVEEQFYFVWPLLVAVALRASKGRIGKLAMATFLLFSLSFGAMIYLSITGNQPESMIADILNRSYLGTDTRAFGIFTGALLAMCCMNTGTVASRKSIFEVMSLAALAGILVLCSTLEIKNMFLYNGGFLLVDVLTLIVIYSFVSLDSGLLKRLFSTKLLEWIGKRSYGIYLWHWPVFRLIGIGQSGYDWVLLRFLVTFLICELSFRFLETPIRQSVLRSGTGSSRKINRVFVVPACSAVIVLSLWSGIILSQQKPYVDEVQQSLALNAKAVDMPTTAIVASDTVSPSADTHASGSDQSVIESGNCEADQNEMISDAVKDVKVTAVGDSVMKGAAIALKQKLGHYLGGNHVTINAEECRSFGLACDILSKYKQNKNLGDVVVIHLGTNNSSIPKREFSKLMEVLSDRSLILFLTVKSDKTKICENVNATLAELVKEVPNARILDWKTLADEHPEYFYSDRTHLRPDGAKFYAATVFRSIAQHLTKEDAPGETAEAAKLSSAKSELDSWTSFYSTSAFFIPKNFLVKGRRPSYRTRTRGA
jgi:peptidoglycan/LPS O-acetylase OafA/YrhL/lysophospholipase L1-like esterase